MQRGCHLRLEWTQRAIHNPDPAAVEAAECEPIESFAIGSAGVGEEANRDVLAELQARHAVGAKMHARGVAAERDIRRQLIDLTSQSELLAAPGLELRAISAGGSAMT